MGFSEHRPFALPGGVHSTQGTVRGGKRWALLEVGTVVGLRRGGQAQATKGAQRDAQHARWGSHALVERLAWWSSGACTPPQPCNEPIGRGQLMFGGSV
eukprot:3414645-Pyramimonas_sp.AAC.2